MDLDGLQSGSVNIVILFGSHNIRNFLTAQQQLAPQDNEVRPN